MDRLSPVSAVSGKRLAVRKSQLVAAGAGCQLPMAELPEPEWPIPGGRHLTPETAGPSQLSGSRSPFDWCFSLVHRASEPPGPFLG